MATERLSNRHNEADLRLVAGKAPALGGGRGVLDGERLQVKCCAQPVEDFRTGHHVLRLPGAAGVQRHKLNETHDEVFVPGKAGQRLNLVIVEAANDNGIDLHRRKAQSLGLLDGRKHFVEAIAAREFFEIGTIQRIEAEAHPSQSSRTQGFTLLAKMESIGGEGEILDAGHAGNLLDEPWHITA